MVLRVRSISFLLAGAAFLSAGTADALESSAIPGSADYMRPKGRMENLPASNASVQQCYIFPTRAGVLYQVESSHDLVNWSPEDSEIYGLGQEQVVTLREFTPPPPPAPGSPLPSPPPPPVHARLRLMPSSGAGGGAIVSWTSLDDKRPVNKLLTQEMGQPWNSMPFYWNRFGNHEFLIAAHFFPIPPPLEDPVLGPKDAAMFAQLETSFPAMTQEVLDNIARARNSPPPAPADPMSRKFFRVRCDWSVDTDGDGTPDWMEFEMAAWQNGGPVPPLRADAFDADTDRNGESDGDRLDYDKDGISNSKDAAPQDGTVCFEIAPPPRYAVFPITGAAGPARQISDLGTVLYSSGTWTAGVWTPLTLSNGGDVSTSAAYAINDHNQIIGGATVPFTSLPAILEGGCFWETPVSAPVLVKLSDPNITAGFYPTSGLHFFGKDHPGPLLSNDGRAFMNTVRYENGEEIIDNGLWSAPLAGAAPGFAPADDTLIYNVDENLKWGYVSLPTMSNSPHEGRIYAPDALPDLPFMPVNVVRLPGNRILAMPGRDFNVSAKAYYDGAWHENTSFAPAIDCSANGTAIGKSHFNLTAPVFINGKWTDINRYAPHEASVFPLVPPWLGSAISLMDSSPDGWILAQKDDGALSDYAAFLPVRVQGQYQKSDGITISSAVGVDDFSINSDSPGDAVQDRIWIMAPQGGNGKTVNFKTPLNGNTLLSLFAANIQFGNQEKATLSAPVVQVTLSASNMVSSGGERLVSMILGTGTNEVLSESKPLGLKIMKGRTVNVTVYKVTKIHGTNAMEPVDRLMMPTRQEISDHLNDLFKPQINTAFHVNLVESPLEVRWDANNNSNFDIDLLDSGEGGEESAILEAVPAAASPFDIRVFIVANVGPLGGEIDAYGITNIATGTCWVHGSKFGRNKTKAFLLESMAHEIGHVMVGEGHPDKSSLGPAPLPGTDHTRRLMCSGARSNSSSRLLVKGEWDAAEIWLKNRPRGDQ